MHALGSKLLAGLYVIAGSAQASQERHELGVVLVEQAHLLQGRDEPLRPTVDNARDGIGYQDVTVCEKIVVEGVASTSAVRLARCKLEASPMYLPYMAYVRNARAGLALCVAHGPPQGICGKGVRLGPEIGPAWQLQ